MRIAPLVNDTHCPSTQLPGSELRVRVFVPVPTVRFVDDEAVGSKPVRPRTLTW